MQPLAARVRGTGWRKLDGTAVQHPYWALHTQQQEQKAKAVVCRGVESFVLSSVVLSCLFLCCLWIAARGGGDAKIENNNNNLPKNSIKHLYDCDLKCHCFTILVLFYKFAAA